MPPPAEIQAAAGRARYAVLLWPLSLVLLPYLLFPTITLGQRAFGLYDLQYYFYPYRKVAADALSSFSLSSLLWNPYANAGMPLLGDGQVALFYPPNWLMPVTAAIGLGPELGFMLGILSSFSIAGLGLYLLARKLAVPRWAAWAGAIAFMFSGYFVAHLIHPSIAATAAWVPWLFWAFERLVQRRSPTRFAAAGLIVALQVFAGHPQIPIYAGLGLAIYAAFLGAPRGLRGIGASIATAAAMYVLGLALAAVQLFPWVHLMSASPRAVHTTFELFDSYSMRGTDWLLFLFPYAYAGPQTSFAQSAGNVSILQLIHTWERLPYVGLLTLALALRGAWEARKTPRGLALITLLLLSLLFAAGGATPLGKLFYHLPVLGQLRAQSRVLIIAAFALTLLATLGLAALARRAAQLKPDRPAILCAALVLVLALIARLLAPATAAPDLTLHLSAANSLLPITLAFATLALLAGSATGRFSRVKATALAALISIDALSLALTFNPTVPAGEFERTPPIVQFLRQDPGPYRIASLYHQMDVPLEAARSALTVSWAMAYGIEDANGFNSLQNRRLVDLLWGQSQQDVTYGLLSPTLLYPPRNKILAALNVKYILVQHVGVWTLPPDWKPVYEDAFVTVLQNPAALSRAFLARTVSPATDPAAVLQQMRDGPFDPTLDALAESIPPELAAQLSLPQTPGDAVDPVPERTDWQPAQQAWHVRTIRPRLLVLSEVFWPGWTVESRPVNSTTWQPLPTFPANYLFRGIALPAGDQIVRLRYRPTDVLAGAIVSLVTFLALLATIATCRFRPAAPAA